MTRRQRLVGVVVVGLLALSGVAVPAVARPAGGDAQKLHGVVTVGFPDYERTSSGCKADDIGSVAKPKKGNRVLVYRGTQDGTSVDISKKPIARGKVGTGTIDAATDDCDVKFTVRKTPVLSDDEFYVVEVRGIAATLTVSAVQVDDGDLGSIPATL